MPTHRGDMPTSPPPVGYIFCFSSLYSTSTSWMTFLCRSLLSSWISLKRGWVVSQVPAAQLHPPCGGHRTEGAGSARAWQGFNTATRPGTSNTWTEGAWRPQQGCTGQHEGVWELGLQRQPSPPPPLLPAQLLKILCRSRWACRGKSWRSVRRLHRMLNRVTN